MQARTEHLVAMGDVAVGFLVDLLRQAAMHPGTSTAATSHGHSMEFTFRLLSCAS